MIDKRHLRRVAYELVRTNETRVHDLCEKFLTEEDKEYIDSISTEPARLRALTNRVQLLLVILFTENDSEDRWNKLFICESLRTFDSRVSRHFLRSVKNNPNLVESKEKIEKIFNPAIDKYVDTKVIYYRLKEDVYNKLRQDFCGLYY